MIKSLQISNFKRFQEISLPLGRLTVLTGANGAGKTSVIHALLLIQRAAATPRPITVALNDSDGLQLGEGADVLNWAAPITEIGFGVTLEPGTSYEWRFAVPEERVLHLPLVAAPANPGPEPFVVQSRFFTYVSAERLGPRDALSASSVSQPDLGVGCYGQYVAQVLAVLSREIIPEGRRTPSPEEEEATLGDLLHQTEWWARRIIRPIELQAEWFANSMITRLRFKTPGLRGEWTRPPNMGFGVSYGLPVIVAGLLARTGGIFVVENPEAHLHPAGQSAMGSFLAQMAADGVQVIVETHSDHILNGIRHAVASPAHIITANDAQILFFLPEGDPHGAVKTLKVSESGAVSGWPQGFFDQFDIDLRAISELQRNRKRRT